MLRNNTKLRHHSSLVLEDFKGDVNITEVADEIAGGIDVAAAELTAPDNVVAGVERKGNVKAVALGLDFDHCGAFPLIKSAAVVFRYHESNLGELLGPVRDNHSVERQGLSFLLALHNDHEVCDLRSVEAQFSLGGGEEIVDGTGLDEELGAAGKPAVVVAFHREFLEDKSLQCRSFC